MVPEIVPEVVDANVPIFTGEAKLPDAFDSCAVKIFPELKVPVIVKGTATVVPAQNGEPEIVLVAIVCFFPANTKNLFVPILLEPETPLAPAVPANVE